MKKVLSLILVFSLVFSLFATPFSAEELSEEKTVTSIRQAEDIVLTENYDGYYSESDGVFYYNFYNRYGNFEDNFEFTVTYSYDTSENITISESKRRDPENCIECNYIEDQRGQPWSLGSENYMLVRNFNVNGSFIVFYNSCHIRKSFSGNHEFFVSVRNNTFFFKSHSESVK